MSKVLITGASGFIGTHLASALAERGETVTCLVRPSSTVATLEALGVRLHRGEVADVDSLREAVAGQDVVYHLAGRTRALGARQFYAVNEHGARAVAEACAAGTTQPIWWHCSLPPRKLGIVWTLSAWNGGQLLRWYRPAA